MISVLIFQAFSGGENLKESMGLGSRSFSQIGEQINLALDGVDGRLNRLKTRLKTILSPPADWLEMPPEDQAKVYIDQYNENYKDAPEFKRRQFIDSLGEDKKAIKKYLEYLKSNSGSESGLRNFIEKDNKDNLKQSKRLKTLGKGLSFVGNVLSTWAISAAIQAVISGINDLINTNENLIRQADEIKSSYNEATSTLNKNKQTVSSIASEYEKLSSGIGTHGENISLTSDQYERYNSLANQIAEMFPSLVTGYTDEGNAILTVATNLQLMNAELEKQKQSANQDLIDQTSSLRAAQDVLQYGYNKGGSVWEQFTSNFSTGWNALFGSNDVPVQGLEGAVNLLESLQQEMGKYEPEQFAKYLKDIPSISDTQEELFKIPDKILDFRNLLQSRPTLFSSTLNNIGLAQKSGESDIDYWTRVAESQDLLTQGIQKYKAELESGVQDNVLSPALATIENLSAGFKSLTSDVQASISTLLSQGINSDWLNEVLGDQATDSQALSNFLDTNIISAIAGHQQDFASFEKEFGTLQQLLASGKITADQYNTSIATLQSLIASVFGASNAETWKIEDLFGIDDVEEQFKSVYDEFQKLFPSARQTEFSILVDTKTNIADATVEQMRQAIEGSKLKDSIYESVENADIAVSLENQYKRFVNTLSSEELSALITLGIDWSQSDLNLDNIKKQINTQILSDSFAENLDAVKTSVEELTTGVEAYQKIMNKAAVGQSLTANEYSELITANAEYADCLSYTADYLTINTEKADKLTAAKTEEALATIDAQRAQEMLRYNDLAADIQNLTDAEKQELDTIEKRITQYNLLESQLEQMSSAYQQWKDSQNAPESGDMYDDMLNAVEAVKNGLKTGLTGTNEFKTAAELLFPDGTEGNIKAKLKQVQKWFSEDSDGANNFIQSALKAGVFQKNQDTGLVEIVEGQTVDGIAAAMETTPDIIRAALGKLSDYGWEINWGQIDVADTTEQFYVLNQSIVDTEARLEELREKGAKRTAAEDAEYKQLQKDLEELYRLQDTDLMKVDTSTSDAYADKVVEIQHLKDQIAQDQALGIDTTESEEKLSLLQQQLNELDKPIEIEVSVAIKKIDKQLESLEKQKETEGVGTSSDSSYITAALIEKRTALETYQQKVQMIPDTTEVDSAIDKLEATKPDINVNTTPARQTILSLQSLWSGLTFETKTMKVVQEKGSSYIPNGMSTGSFASGTAKAAGDFTTKKAERALVGELGRELVVSN